MLQYDPKPNLSSACGEWVLQICGVQNEWVNLMAFMHVLTLHGRPLPRLVSGLWRKEICRD